MEHDFPESLGKYRLVQRLGRGGAAEVWLALDQQLQRNVAIKLLHSNLREDPDFVERFQEEARAIASLHHPNIVQVHDFQIYTTPDPQQSPLAFMVMDYVEGKTLADYIAGTSNRGRIPSSQKIVNLFASIGQAVDYAHQQGFIHRDIKPANILLDARNVQHNSMGEPILTDFGLVRMVGLPFNPGTDLRQGTLLYISPEQVNGYQASAASDLYSLGVILYEVVTGVRPFQGAKREEILDQHRRGTPRQPSLINPRIPPSLEFVMKRSLDKNPAARYQSAAEMVIALASALNVTVPATLGGAVHTSPTAQMIEIGGDLTAQSVHTPMLSEQTNSDTIGASGAPNASGTASVPVRQPARAISSAGGRTRRRWSSRYTFGAIVLVALIILSTALAYLYLPTFASEKTTGTAAYLSSGIFDEQHPVGIADRLLIDLSNVGSPHAGKSYHAWLLGDANPLSSDDLVGPPPITVPILMTSALPVQQGHIHYIYMGDAHHDDLLSATSRLLITEEDANSHNAAPSTDHSTWRYYATLPSQPIPNDPVHLNALTHIRHLFYQETNVKVLGLNGGLDIWLYRNTEKVFELSVTARDAWNWSNSNTGQMNDMINKILGFLDGRVQGNFQHDEPTLRTPNSDPIASKIGLLDVNGVHQGDNANEVNPDGYLKHTTFHVDQISQAIDITPSTRANAVQIVNDLRSATGWLQQVHHDDVLLYSMGQQPGNQLTSEQARTLLNDMVTQATYAYIGKLNVSTDQVQGGVSQIHFAMQGLATMQISSNVPDHL